MSTKMVIRHGRLAFARDDAGIGGRYCLNCGQPKSAKGRQERAYREMCTDCITKMLATITVYDRDSGFGHVPLNLVKSYGLTL